MQKKNYYLVRNVEISINHQPKIGHVPVSSSPTRINELPIEMLNPVLFTLRVATKPSLLSTMYC